ncbi:uncharacterized protein [Ptychodera flava]|uniref:uncharacterized protein n=1 Tax=Ptychodera flava TaxID=63121 RepID=UPI00396A6603
MERKKSTLGDRVTRRVEMCRRSGPSHILIAAEEESIANWLINIATRGFGVTKPKLLHTVKRILDKNGRETPLKRKDPPNLPGDKWCQRFLQRNPKVKLVSTRKLDVKRAKVSKAEVDKWFQHFEVFLSDHQLLDKPTNIWNCDESGFSTQVKTGKVLGPWQFHR